MRHLPNADRASLFDALRSSGLHPYELSDEPLIVNVHSAEVTSDEDDDESYLYTLTVTITE